MSLIQQVQTVFLIVLCVLLQESMAQPAFTFESRDPSFGDDFRIDVRCNRPADGPNVGCSGGWSNSGDQTPFLQELYLDQASGEYYYHVIVGSPESGFAQETYTKANGPTWEGGRGSASLGDGNCRSNFFSFNLSLCNLGDPLGVSHDNTFTGIGSGNPKAVLMRQVMGGTWDGATKSWSCQGADGYCLEFLKDAFLLKPKITQTVRDAATNMTGYFEFDMSNSDYDTGTIAGTMVNTLTFTDPDMAAIANFDFATSNTNGSVLTGGRYIFTGTGPTDATLEPYQYWGDVFTLDTEWSIFRDASQNP